MQIISPVLKALADENEFVRETAYKAGQRLVLTYAEKAIALLLPELELGLFDDNWRIRHSSIQLLGDLLYRISGVSGKMTTETAGEDDNFGTEQSQQVILEALGQDRRNRVLAGLYMGRSDVALLVRQASLHVWKVVVSNTPKTLREILPTLFNLLLGCLASNSYDKRQVAARTLGDLVKKLGERVLPEIIPILEKGLESDAPEKRQGVCVGLSEIMTSTSRDMVLSFTDSLVPTVQKALCDDNSDVRKAAAKTFDSLHSTVGAKALDDILPVMLERLSDKSEETAKERENILDGLRLVMAIKARAVLPYLIPQLIAPPVNMKALASVGPVAGDALHRHLVKIMPALISSIAQAHPNEAESLSYAQAVVLSVSDENDDAGLSYIMDELLSVCGQTDDAESRRAAVMLLHVFCKDTKMDISGYVPQLIRCLILMFNDKDQTTLQEAWNALLAVTKSLEPADQMVYVSDVRQAVRFAMSDVKREGATLAGFCLPKGIQPVLSIFRESILNGVPELKEQAAKGLSEVIKVSSADALKPSVVHITGPLIRILGDRFAANVKTAVLDTLASLLKKASVLLKPFFPQLQTTFMKALNDPNRTVRLMAGSALAHLIAIHMRPDPLFNELATGIKTASDDSSVRDTYLQALRLCLEPAGDKMSAPIRRQILPQLLTLISHPDDVTRATAGGALGVYMKWLPEEDAESVLVDHLLASDDDWTVRHGRSTALFVAMKEAPERVYSKYEVKVVKNAAALLKDDRVPVVLNGMRTCAYLFDFLVSNAQSLPVDLLAPFCRSVNHNSNDVKQLLAVTSTFLAKQNATRSDKVLPGELLKPLLPMLLNGTKEKNSAVKSSCEGALVTILKLREGPSASHECLQLLEPGARDAMQETITKVLQRVANQPEGKEEVVDDTILT